MLSPLQLSGCGEVKLIPRRPQTVSSACGDRCFLGRRRVNECLWTHSKCQSWLLGLVVLFHNLAGLEKKRNQEDVYSYGSVAQRSRQLG